MANENGTWIMKGLALDDPYRIRTWQELVNWVNADEGAIIGLIGKRPKLD